MAVHRIEVRPTTDAGDPRGDAARRQAESAGLSQLPSRIDTTSVYLVEGDLDEAAVRRLADEVLADPVTEQATIRAAPAAADASLEGYAFVSAKAEPRADWIHDTGLVYTPHAARVVGKKPWRLRRQKWFRYELKMILNGEITAFRHAARLAATENPGKEIIIYTDNANVFHAIQKGRSRSKPLNILCRNVLFLEVLQGVRIHARWIPSAHMPADKYTRRATYPGYKYK